VACPVAASRAWLDAAGITTGPVFRSIRKGGKVGDRLTDQSVAHIVKFHAARVGLNPADFSSHPLCAGFLASAAKRGTSIFKLMDASATARSKRCAAMYATPSCSRSRCRRAAVAVRSCCRMPPWLPLRRQGDTCPPAARISLDDFRVFPELGKSRWCN
jgi:hypothetical protein